MDKSVYRNAIEHLKFSNELNYRVEIATKKRPHFSLLRVAVLAAVICGLLSFTVYAVDGWLNQNLDYTNLGTETLDGSDAKLLELDLVYDNEGISIHTMKLHPSMNYATSNGFISNGSNGVYRITEDYQLEKVELKQVIRYFHKNGVEYSISLLYVPVEGGILTVNSIFYPMTDGEILINAQSNTSGNWPVYLNLDTLEVRDALPQYDQDDFEGIESFQSYKNGFLVGTFVENENRSYNLEYVVNLKEGTLTLVDMNGAYSFVHAGEIYFQDIKKNRIYHYTDSGECEPLDVVYSTKDLIEQGLLTVCLGNDTLGVIDVGRQVTYRIPDVKVNAYKLDWKGTNATRYSVDGKIVVTERYYDYENRREAIASISVLDPESNQYKKLEIETDYAVSSCMWLDHDRYAIICQGDEGFFLYIYEFE